MTAAKSKGLSMTEIYIFVGLFLVVTAGIEIFAGLDTRPFGQSMLISIGVGLVAGLLALGFRLLVLRRHKPLDN